MGFALFSVSFWVVFQSAESDIDVGSINCRQNVADINCPWNTICRGTCLYTCADIPRRDDDPTKEIWGTKVYTYHSSICKAATHDLRLSTWNKTNLSFVLKRVPYNGNYWSSIRSGIHSYSYLNQPSPQDGSFIFLSPKVKENILDVASIQEAFLFSDAENNVQTCMAANNSNSFSFKIFTAEPGSPSVTAEMEQKGNLKVYKMHWPELKGEAQTQGFQCYPQDSTLSVVTSLAMTANADFYPSSMTTHVANVNENVTLLMEEHSQRSSSCEYTWKKDDEKLPEFINKSAQQRTSLFLFEVQEGSQGLYSLECDSDSNKRALLRLTVRACPKDRFGDNCTEECPDCKNGGVCHDITGVCICAPGFSGATCLNRCPPGYFGQKCSMSCPVSSTSQGIKPSCKGYLICLPDPYGCSCASGYKGVFCNDSYPVLTAEVKLEESTDTSLRISFREWFSDLDIGNGTPSVYRVFYKRNSEETWSIKDFTAASTPWKRVHYMVVFVNLRPDSEYAFRVVVLDANGQSQEEGVKEYLFSTTCGTPTKPPLNVEISAEETMVFVSWKLPPKAFWNCRTVKPIVKYNSFVSKDTPTQTFYSFTSKPFTNWNVTVCLENGNEDNNCAETINVITKEDAPGVVRDFTYTNVSPRSIALTWKDPLEKNGVIRSFSLQYRQTRWRHICQEPFDPKILTVKVDHVNTMVEDLNPSAVYIFQLAAITVKEGASQILIVFTEIDVPSGRPRGLGYSSNDESLKWKPPFCNESNGKITKYWISVTGLSSSDLYQRNGTTQTPTFGVPLLNSSMYEAKVFASTGAGFGDPYVKINFMAQPKNSQCQKRISALALAFFFLTTMILLTCHNI